MIKIIYYTHSTVLLNINSVNILVDPFFTNNPKISKSNFYINSFKYINYILVTHAHSDHTKDVQIISKKYNSTIISNYEICKYYKNCKTLSLNYGSFIKINKKINIRYVYALHSSSFEDGTYGGNPGGFIIKSQKKTIYISGDTDIFNGMKYFNENFNLLILPIGGRYTMNVKYAYLASNLLRCNYILGVHYNTYPEIKINKKKAIYYFKKKKKNLFLLKKNNYIIL
ncbi:MAG: metal-dependent hydrolase [Candidatus Shikimatogenerans bostrichidophilus]|nr:MAG: metal-dependent hydrolase [Candidatus Shikimatogenerans bostrichidophilus]